MDGPPINLKVYQNPQQVYIIKSFMIYEKNILIVSKNFTELELTLFIF